LLKEILKIGKIPTPPYIKTQVKNSEYQNVFAKTLGSAAAPTAGLHFTKRLINKLKRKGIQIEFVTLHVGLGTFQPVRTNVVEEHQIHSEYYEVTQKTLKRLQSAKKENRRIIAVGTTSCRVLETISSTIRNPRPNVRSYGRAQSVTRNLTGDTSIFIFPGYKFKVVDSLITNFHTPYSSLLALVMALAGKPLIKKAYAMAIKKKYKFFSLGDGMFID
jgi:S-adenosylmethionine:tRNA ribosyltransferase-isomerase